MEKCVEVIGTLRASAILTTFDGCTEIGSHRWLLATEKKNRLVGQVA